MLLINVKCCDIEPSRESWPSLPTYEVIVSKRVMKQYQLKYAESSAQNCTVPFGNLMQGYGPFACEDSIDGLNLINDLMVDIVLSVLRKFCPNTGGNLWGHHPPATIGTRKFRERSWTLCHHFVFFHGSQARQRRW